MPLPLTLIPRGTVVKYTGPSGSDALMAVQGTTDLDNSPDLLPEFGELGTVTEDIDLTNLDRDQKAIWDANPGASVFELYTALSVLMIVKVRWNSFKGELPGGGAPFLFLDFGQIN
jgi:hypothetical protein